MMMMNNGLSKQYFSSKIGIVDFNMSKKDILKSNEFYGTYNGFNNVKSDKRIDYVFFRNLTLINSKHVYLKTKANKWGSDHHPVVASLKHIN